MSEQPNALAQPSATDYWSRFQVDEQGMRIDNVGGVYALASVVEKSGMAPTSLKTREQIFTAMMMGAELGLSPLQAIRNIGVINGRPSVWGDAQLSLVRRSGELVEFVETYIGKPYDDDFAAVCKVVRKGGGGATEELFSVGDAKRAGLWGKAGPWQQYPKRMLRYRARAFALRDTFGDILGGFLSREEAEDTPAGEPVQVIPTSVRVLPSPVVESEPVAEPTRRRRKVEAVEPVVETPPPAAIPSPEEAEAIREAEAASAAG